MIRAGPFVKSVKIEIKNCKHCPNCKIKLTKGFGYATDFDCHAIKPVRTIAGYCEWSDEEPQDGEIPAWCPLVTEVAEPKKKVLYKCESATTCGCETCNHIDHHTPNGCTMSETCRTTGLCVKCIQDDNHDEYE